MWEASRRCKYHSMYLERRLLGLNGGGGKGMYHEWIHRGGRGEGGDRTWIRGRRENEERELNVRFFINPDPPVKASPAARIELTLGMYILL